MSGPRIDQVNVVVGDVEAATRFLSRLGLDIPSVAPGWGAHHRSLPAATSTHSGHDEAEPAFEIDLDSATFAGWWGGLPPSFRGVVVNLRVDERAEVDRLHALAPAAGGESLRTPYDAFWGSRFAVVEGPGPIVVGLMSVPDEARRSAPPDPASLA